MPIREHPRFYKISRSSHLLRAELSGGGSIYFTNDEEKIANVTNAWLTLDTEGVLTKSTFQGINRLLLNLDMPFVLNRTESKKWWLAGTRTVQYHDGILIDRFSGEAVWKEEAAAMDEAVSVKADAFLADLEKWLLFNPYTYKEDARRLTRRGIVSAVNDGDFEIILHNSVKGSWKEIEPKLEFDSAPLVKVATHFTRLGLGLAVW